MTGCNLISEWVTCVAELNLLFVTVMVTSQWVTYVAELIGFARVVDITIYYRDWRARFVIWHNHPATAVCYRCSRAESFSKFILM